MCVHTYLYFYITNICTRVRYLKTTIGKNRSNAHQKNIRILFSISNVVPY